MVDGSLVGDGRDALGQRSREAGSDQDSLIREASHGWYLSLYGSIRMRLEIRAEI